MRVLTAEQMREADRRTIDDVGIASSVLMENAGRQIAAAMHATLEELASCRVGVLCGRGNNGGDGLVVARVLSEQGIDVRVFLFGRAADLAGDASVNLEAADRLGLSIVEVPDRDAWDEAQPAVTGCDVLVDAVFGTGLSRPLNEFLSVVAAGVNELDVLVVAVDLPSGLSADSPDPIGEAFEADVTVTLTAPKIALLLPPAESWAGDLVVADIGIPDAIIDGVSGDRLDLLTPEEVRLLIPPRPRDAHKGDFGHVLVVAGAVGTTGAARLAGLGALRSGAGLVTIATPRPCVSAVASMTPEYMTLPLPVCDDGLLQLESVDAILSHPCDVIAIGPGLGRSPQVAAVVWALLDRADRPLVLDADALTVLAEDPQQLKGRPDRPIIITPHPGEMARLCQSTSADVQADRLGTAQRFAVGHELFVVLKGAGTVIAGPDGAAWLNLTGNAGMATGGMGDVLTGMTAAWLAQLRRAHVACQVAVFLHGRAGDLAADEHGEIGLVATDLVGMLGRAARETVNPSVPEDHDPET